jgi:hypothetical protein
LKIATPSTAIPIIPIGRQDGLAASFGCAGSESEMDCRRIEFGLRS